MRTTLRDYWDLTKPKVVALIVFTALVGMFLAIPGWPTAAQATTGAVAFIGIWLSAGAAAAINQLLDARIDAQMARTSWRPLVVGKVTPRQVLVFAAALTALSMTILVLWVNVITAVLTFASLIGYAVVYTVYLKRATSQNIVIGGLAGATPPLLGWAAVTGMQGGSDWAYASLLVLIIFVWTPPHFWALALLKSEDYARAGVPMLPVVAGEAATRTQILAYSLLLFPVGLMPWALGFAGTVHGIVAAVGGTVFVALAALVFVRREGAAARRACGRLFAFSILHLFALFAVLAGERIVAAL